MPRKNGNQNPLEALLAQLGGDGDAEVEVIGIGGSGGGSLEDFAAMIIATEAQDNYTALRRKRETIELVAGFDRGSLGDDVVLQFVALQKALVDCGICPLNCPGHQKKAAFDPVRYKKELDEYRREAAASH